MLDDSFPYALVWSRYVSEYLYWLLTSSHICLLKSTYTINILLSLIVATGLLLSPLYQTLLNGLRLLTLVITFHCFGILLPRLN